LTEDYNLELQYRKPFLEIWEDEKNDRELGPLSERMGVRDRNTGELLMTEEEKDAVSKCFSPLSPKLLLLANPGQASIMHFVSTRFKPVLIYPKGLCIRWQGFSKKRKNRQRSRRSVISSNATLNEFTKHSNPLDGKLQVEFLSYHCYVTASLHVGG
jgi:hypothetical protein